MPALLDCRKRFTDAAWACSQVWHNEGRAIKWIARALVSTPATVRYNLQRLMPSQRAAVAPPCISHVHFKQIKSRKDLVKRLVLEMSTDCRGRRRRMYPSTSDIARAVNIASRTSVCAETIRRDLRSLGFTAKARPRGYKRDPVKRVTECKIFLKIPARRVAKLFSLPLNAAAITHEAAAKETVLTNEHGKQKTFNVQFIPHAEVNPKDARRVIECFTEYCGSRGVGVNTTPHVGPKVNLYTASTTRGLNINEFGVKIGARGDMDFKTVWKELGGDVIPEHEMSQEAFDYLFHALQQK